MDVVALSEFNFFMPGQHLVEGQELGDCLGSYLCAYSLFFYVLTSVVLCFTHGAVLGIGLNSSSLGSFYFLREKLLEELVSFLWSKAGGYCVRVIYIVHCILFYLQHAVTNTFAEVGRLKVWNKLTF